MKYNIILYKKNVLLGSNLFAYSWLLGNADPFYAFSSVYHYFWSIENIIENIIDELLLDVYDELY